MRARGLMMSFGLIAFAPVTASSQTKPIPVVTLPVLAESKETFVVRPIVRGLPNGRVLVHDGRGQRVIVFDPSTSTETGSGLVYDVVNRKGELFERVRVPKDCVVVGFGRDGVVILARNNTRTKTWTLTRSRLLRN